MELQQSPLYGKYIHALKWDVLSIDGIQMFYKRIPFIGGLLKIQRPAHLPDLKKLLPLIKEHHVKTVAIEPVEQENLSTYKRWVKTLEKYVRVTRSSYQPTKTIRINTTPTENEIFRVFSEAKRRAVRKAGKNGIVIKESSNIQDLIAIKNKSGGFFGFITTIGIDKLWSLVYPNHATILLAYNQNQKLIAGVLLLFWNKTAYYWIAGATKEGKKLFAPTLLVWEALKTSKNHDAHQFDFLGVWDERKPKEHKDWLGFTKFKEGFGGTSIYYPIY